MQLSDILDRIRARVQVKLARQGMPTDREMLAEVCTAIASLVRDPDGVQLYSSLLSAEEFSAVEECLVMAERDFAEEVAALRRLIASLEQDLAAEMGASVSTGQIQPAHAPHAIQEMVLTLLISPDGSHGDSGDG